VVVEHAGSMLRRIPFALPDMAPELGRTGVLDTVVLARSGDHAAFETLARAAAPRLEAVAKLILRDGDLAADAVQEALVRAWRDLPGLRDPAAFDAWLHRLLVRACMDVGRSRQRFIQLQARVLETPRTADMAIRLAMRDEMEQAFGRLDSEQRAILALRYHADLDLADVARALSIPLGTAKSRLHRALGALRAALDAESRGSVNRKDAVP
jgi:RNA polymerase sigma-70 factor (ECF subfamily)